MSIIIKTLAKLQREAHENSVNHGFWDDDPAGTPETEHLYRVYLGNKLALIHDEVSEAHEELRKDHEPHEVYYREDGKPEGLPFELADVVIRVLDLAERLDLDLYSLIEEKMRYNASRPPLHGKLF